jgi:hypothetical protein
MAKAIVDVKSIIDEPTGLDLWNQLEVTDPRMTKQFDRGSFKGTAVDALFNVKRLTEHFGPVGGNWGWKVLSERLDTFGTDKDAQTIHSLTLRAWFVQPDGQVHEFDHIGHTKVAYWTRGQNARFMVDDEFGKKSLTDALSKVMVCLGASADVWLGRFDGNKYYEPPKADDVAPAQEIEAPAKRQPAAAKANGHANGNGYVRTPAEEAEDALAAADPLKLNGLPIDEFKLLLLKGVKERPFHDAQAAVDAYGPKLKGMLTDLECAQVRDAWKARKAAWKAENVTAAG